MPESRQKQERAAECDPLLENQGQYLGGRVARLLVRCLRVLVSFLGVLVGLVRMLVGFFVVALLMVFRSGVVRLGCVLVMLGCFAMCFVCHKAP
jgi:hypothetical protein